MRTSDFAGELQMPLVRTGLQYQTSNDEPAPYYYSHPFSQFWADQDLKPAGGTAGCVAVMLAVLNRDLERIQSGACPIWLSGTINTKSPNSDGFSAILLSDRVVERLLPYRGLMTMAPWQLEKIRRSEIDPDRKDIVQIAWDLEELRRLGLLPVQFQELPGSRERLLGFLYRLTRTGVHPARRAIVEITGFATHWSYAEKTQRYSATLN